MRGILITDTDPDPYELSAQERPWNFEMRRENNFKWACKVTAGHRMRVVEGLDVF